LGIVDWISFKPVFVAHLADFFPGPIRDTGGQSATLPDKSSAKADCAADQAVDTCSTPMFLCQAAQNPDQCTGNGGTNRAAGCHFDEGNETFALQESFFARVRPLRR